MSPVPRRTLVMAAAATLASFVIAPATAEAHAPGGHDLPAVAASASTVTIDGQTFRGLPPTLGSIYDSEYEFDDVRFVARVWESRVSDGWRVDGQVSVMRGAPLHSHTALRDWYTAYQERPAGEGDVRSATVGGHRVWVGTDQAYWLVRPGVAMTVRLDASRYSQARLRHVVRRSLG